MPRAAQRFAKQLRRRQRTLHGRRSRRRWQASLKRSQPKLSNGDATKANCPEGRHGGHFLWRSNMMLQYTSSSDADLGGEALAEMAKYAIKCAQISQFFYGGYRYTNLA